MFGWLKRIFSKEDLGFYKPKERLIYKYFDGSKNMTADPMLLYRRLMEKSPDLSIDIQVSNSVSKDRNKARDSMLEKIRWIFSLRKFEEEGLTEAECELLLEHFVNWCDDLKKKYNPSLISHTETLPPTKVSSVDNQHIQNTLDSGSTEVETNTEEPIQWH